MKLLILFYLFVIAITVASGLECKPGSTFMADCNKCTCSDDGSHAICTLMACVPREPWGPLYIQGQPCPSKRFYSECNECTCRKNGRSAVCTKKLCHAPEQIS